MFYHIFIICDKTYNVKLILEIKDFFFKGTKNPGVFRHKSAFSGGNRQFPALFLWYNIIVEK